jgi:hypothetical protein
LARPSLIIRLTRRILPSLIAWRDRKFGPPNVADALVRESEWDFQQADLRSWDSEPDTERLAEALSVHTTDPQRALVLLHVLAEENSPLAMNAIGERYYWGRGVVPIDKPEAEKWFRRAFEHGSRRGLLNLGKALWSRDDLDGAEAVFRAGADADWAPAFYWLAKIQLRRSWRRKSLSTVRLLLERAQQAGSPAARVDLGILMTLGFFGLGQMRRGRQLLDEDWQWNLAASKTTNGLTASGETIH